MELGAVGDFLPDGSNAGHGIFQETSSWESTWRDPLANSQYALKAFLQPAWDFWMATGLEGDDLVRAIASSFNAGLGQAWKWHQEGDVDLGTTDRYGQRALDKFHTLTK